MEARGDSGAQALVNIRIWGDNGRAQGQVVMTVGQRYTFLRENNDHDWTSLIAGGNYVNQGTNSYGPQIVMLAASRAQTVCYTGGNAGFPQGGQGCWQRTITWITVWMGWQRRRRCWWSATGYLSGTGGLAAHIIVVLVELPSQGNFLSGGYGGRPWFQEQDLKVV